MQNSLLVKYHWEDKLKDDKIDEHVACIGDVRNTEIILAGKSKRKRLHGRSKHREGIIFIYNLTSKLWRTIMILICIRDVVGSNLGHKTNYHDKFSWFSSLSMRIPKDYPEVYHDYVLLHHFKIIR
jgi:hypothetical protein